MPAPVVMVHGAFCGGWVFDRFQRPFRAAGHAVFAPDLRGHSPDSQPEALAGVSMTDYADDIAALCADLPEPPVLVGHSMGGLVAQMAATRTPIKALVLLAPSPPWGIMSTSLEEAMAAVGVHLIGSFFGGPVTPDRVLMRTYTLDRVPAREKDAVLARMGRESGRAVFETLNWWLDPSMTTRLAEGPLEVPGLVLVGSSDAVHPPATVRQIAQRIGAEYRLLPGMSHWLPDEPGRERVADEILAWLGHELVAA
jgi:pimeloyl-ACP methyl ester carboxylesterase